jgi:hypothetical protein
LRKSSYDGACQRPTLNNILKRLLKQPTAPFHEYHVRAEIEALLKGCPHVKLKRDKFGNLLATYKNGKSKSKPTWVLGAHMDHPALSSNRPAARSVMSGISSAVWARRRSRPA